MNDDNRPDLAGFPGLNGYKNDGRGTWYDNGQFSVRHSVDLLPNGTIEEHTVTTNKATGDRVINEAHYPPFGGGSGEGY